MIKKGSYVEIEVLILKSNERAPQVPEDTKLVPLMMRVKGTLLSDAKLEEIVEITTDTQRVETGKLIKKDPAYLHNFGEYVEELKTIRNIILSETGDLNE